MGIQVGPVYGSAIGSVYGAGSPFGGLSLVVIAGQSNARGNGNPALATETGLGTPYPNVQEQTHIDLTGGVSLSWTDTGPRDLQGRTATECGIELKLGRVLDAAIAKQWAITKCAVDSTSINANWGPLVNYPAGDPLGNLFTQFIAYLRSSSAALKASIRHIIWIQGEADAGGQAAAGAYQANFAAFIAAVRAQLGTNFTFYFVKLNVNCTQAFTADVRSAQDAILLSDSSLQMMIADDLPLTGGLHYDTDGLYTMGNRFAQAILNTHTLSTITIAPDGPTISSGGTLQLSVYADYTSKIRRNVLAQTSWQSSNPSVATISNTGLLAGIANGSCVITATYQGVQDTLNVHVSAIPVDATSGKAVPTTQADWDAVNDAAGVAHKTLAGSFPFQDTDMSAAVVATVGTNLTTYGGPTARASVTGWARKAMRCTETAQGAGYASGTGPNAGSTSVAWFAYIDITANPGAARPFLSGSNAGTANARASHVNGAGGLNRVQCNAVNVDGVSDARTGGVRPYMFVYNRTAGTVKLYSDQEKITGTYSSLVTDSTKGFPATATVVPPAMDVLLGACWSGANAELTDADVKAIFQAMGWTIPWS